MKIGITGGIASGKSTLCEYLQKSGYTIFNSDIETRKFADDPIIKQKIIKAFGEESYKDGVYNSDYVRNIAFNDKKQLDVLNNIYGDLVLNKYLELHEKNYQDKLFFFESAVLFEKHMEDNFDKIIGVVCNEKNAVARVKERNTMTLKEALNIISFQMNPYKKMKLCDYVINTDEAFNEKQINDILVQLKNLTY